MPPLSPKPLVIILCVISLLLVPPAFGEPSPESLLTLGVGRDFYDGIDSRSFLHGSTCSWEGLTYLDENLRPVPWLAKSWKESDAGKTWTFYLRSGVRFHDGSLLVPEDVVTCVKRMMNNFKYDPAGNYRHVESISTGESNSVIFHLKEPVPFFPKLVAYYASPIIKPTVFDSQGRIKKLIATGPYKVEYVAPGEEILLNSFDGYWGKPASYNKVSFRFIPDARTRVLALMAGEVDAVADVGGILPEQAEELKGYAGINLKQVEVATTHVILFNCKRPPFSDVKARLWFSGIVDREGIVDAFARGAGKVAFSPITPLASDFAFDSIKPVKAKPGFFVPKGDKNISILLHGGLIQRWPYADIAQVIREVLSAYGLTADIIIREAGGYHEAVKKGNFHLALQPYTLMTGDPDYFYSYWIASDAPRNCGWKNPEADRLVKAARREMDLASRIDMYKKLGEIIARDLPIFPLYHDFSLYAHRERVGNFNMDHLFKPGIASAFPIKSREEK